MKSQLYCTGKVAVSSSWRTVQRSVRIPRKRRVEEEEEDVKGIAGIAVGGVLREVRDSANSVLAPYDSVRYLCVW